LLVLLLSSLGILILLAWLLGLASLPRRQRWRGTVSIGPLPVQSARDEGTEAIQQGGKIVLRTGKQALQRTEQPRPSASAPTRSLVHLLCLRRPPLLRLARAWLLCRRL
jgi:hypothetical protein